MKVILYFSRLFSKFVPLLSVFIVWTVLLQNLHILLTQPAYLYGSYLWELQRMRSRTINVVHMHSAILKCIAIYCTHLNGAPEHIKVAQFGVRACRKFAVKLNIDHVFWSLLGIWLHKQNIWYPRWALMSAHALRQTI